MRRPANWLTPCIEVLEDRNLLSTIEIPLQAGRPVTFNDTDGSLVRIKLTGPGYGSVTLTNGLTAGGQLDTLQLHHTTGGSSLAITSTGGTIPGTSIQQILIDNSANRANVLASLTTKNIDLADGARFQTDGSVGQVNFRYTGADTEIAVAGSMAGYRTSTVGAYVYVHTAGTLGTFRTAIVDRGTQITAGVRIGSFAVSQEVRDHSVVTAGAGGIGKVNVGDLNGAVIAAVGPIGPVTVKYDMIASSLASNIAPGADGHFASLDDIVVNPAAKGKIQSVTIKGELQGSSDPFEYFGIVTNAILGPVRVGGQRLTVPDLHNNVWIRNRPLTGGGGATPVDYSVATSMNWDPTSGPHYATDVDYQSTTLWQTLKVINYEPSHYPKFDANGDLVDVQGHPLGDTSFQANLGIDFPPGGLNYGTFVNYILGNPAITIANDLVQLQAAGFNGVRLYNPVPKVYVATILAAHELTQRTGQPFYVYYEVAAPDLSSTNFYGGTVAERETKLFTAEVSDNRPAPGPEGSLQSLHYVINLVGAQVFSEVVPLVFFSHEMLVSPNNSNPTTLNDSNSSVPLLRWGINATRELLTIELGTNPLPAVTTALLAGQVVSVSDVYQPEVKKLIDTIQHDPNAPIAYDDYPFQWGNRYFDQVHPYTNGAGLIPNAYPPGTQNYSDNTSWIGGQPAPAPTHTIQDTVNEADLMWSLAWMTERVDHIYGNGGPAKQLIAETGWATAGGYQDASGRQIVGDLNDAKTYFETLQQASFKVGNTPVMYFSAYDEPLKEGNATLFSENHYGVFGWSNIPKFFSDSTTFHPLTRPFAVLGVNPTNPNNGTPVSNPGQTATDAAYTLQLSGGTLQSVPWFWGGQRFSNDRALGSSITWIPNADILVPQGQTVTIASLKPGSSLPAQVQIQFVVLNNVPTLQFVDPSQGNQIGNLAYQGDANGHAWKLFLAFPWLHDGSNNFNSPTFKPAYQDFWAKP